MTDKMKKEDKEIPTRNSGKNGKDRTIAAVSTPGGTGALE